MSFLSLIDRFSFTPVSRVLLSFTFTWLLLRHRAIQMWTWTWTLSPPLLLSYWSLLRLLERSLMYNFLGKLSRFPNPSIRLPFPVFGFPKFDFQSKNKTFKLRYVLFYFHRVLNVCYFLWICFFFPFILFLTVMCRICRDYPCPSSVFSRVKYEFFSTS